MPWTRAYLESACAPDPAGRGIDSRSWMYSGSRVYPYQRIMNGEIPEGDGFGDWFRKKFSRWDRRSIPPDGLLTVNEALHVSVLERWNKDAVPHDCPESKDCKPRPYRPVNLAAVIEARRAGRVMPVVGWDGEVLGVESVPWPV